MEVNALRIALLVNQLGSFAAVARALDSDPSSVSRTVSNLETELGIRLFQRSTRTLSSTEEGAAYLSRIEPLLEEFDRAHDIARNATKRPSGRLRLTASVAFSHQCIVPHLGRFQARYPDISVELLPNDENLDLTANSIDLAIRLAPAPSGELISTRLMTTRYYLVASADYVARHAVIARPDDLQDHNCLRLALPEFRTRWKFRLNDEAPIAVPVGGKLIIANALSLRRAALDGLGPALLADWLIDKDRKDGSLDTLLPDYHCTATEFDTAAWALYPSRSFLPQKVRCMIDFLRDCLRE